MELHKEIFYSLTFGYIITLFFFIRKIKLKIHKDKFDKKTHLSLLYSTLSIALLFNYEKIVISLAFSKDVFADYFFAYTVLFLPINVVASYISQVALVDFKDHKKSISFIENCNKYILIITSILVIYFSFIHLFTKFISINISINYMFYFLFFSCLRVLDSLFASLLSLHATHKQIANLNKYPNIYMLIFIVIIYVYPSLTLVLVFQLSLWLIRIYIYYKVAHKLNLTTPNNKGEQFL
ncbi:hypothetical protein Xekk_01186 [Xenorhabdus sp. KK7.4]|nr:hypothetical protein Xekk_01186 [Xenorhabdus sp. KK7.4]